MSLDSPRKDTGGLSRCSSLTFLYDRLSLEENTQTPRLPPGYARFGPFKEAHKLFNDTMKSLWDQIQDSESPSCDPVQLDLAKKIYVKCTEPSDFDLDKSPLLKDLLNHVSELRTKEDLVSMWGKWSRFDIFPLYRVGVVQDLYDHLKLKIWARLCPRFPFNPFSKKWGAHQQSWMDYLGKLMPFLSDQELEECAYFYHRLAIIFWQFEKNQSLYNVTPYSVLEHEPEPEPEPKPKPNTFSWSTFFSSLGADIDECLIQSLDSIQNLGALIETTELNTLKNWSEFVLRDTLAPFISFDFHAIHFEYHQVELRGVRFNGFTHFGLEQINTWFPQLMMSPFIEHLHDEDADNLVRRVFDRVREAGLAYLEQVDWLDDESKAWALRQLRELTVLICPPKPKRHKVPSFDERFTLVDNELMRRRSRCDSHLNSLGRSGKSDDKMSWKLYSLHSICYRPLANQIVVPVTTTHTFAKLEREGEASLFGQLGNQIGHEIAHAIDPCRFGYASKSQQWSSSTLERYQSFIDDIKTQVDELNLKVKICPDHTINETFADRLGAVFARNAYAIGNPFKEEAFIRAFKSMMECVQTPQDRLLRYDLDQHPPLDVRKALVLSTLGVEVPESQPTTSKRRRSSAP